MMAVALLPASLEEALLGEGVREVVCPAFLTENLDGEPDIHFLDLNNSITSL